MPSMPTVFRWLSQHEEFRAMYTAAREAQATTSSRSCWRSATTRAMTGWRGRLRTAAPSSFRTRSGSTEAGCGLTRDDRFSLA
jgi:hypothetical protein